MPLQIRRGTAAERSGLTTPLAVGELLYVTDQGKLYIGDGTSIGSSDIVGNPGQGGKGLIITGFTSEEAQDATALLFNNGTHTNIFYTYDDVSNSLSSQVTMENYSGNINVDGIVDADFRGSLFADDSGLLVDAVDRKFFGTLEGNVVGDVNGSIFANDSTTLVDAETGVIRCTDLFVNGADIPTAFSFTLVGDDSTTTAVSPGTTLRMLGSLGIRTYVNPEGEFLIESENNFVTTTPVDISKTTSHHITFTESLFAEDSPINTAGAFTYVPNTETLTVTNIQCGTLDAATSVATTDIFAGQIYANNALYLISLLTTGVTRRQVSVGDTTTSGRFQVINSTYEAGFPLVSIQQSHDTADALNFGFYRTRNNASAPTAVQNGDDLADITFLGWDGSNWATGAAINVTVDGSVSTGVAPTKITIETMNDSGSRLNALTITKNQQTHFDGAIKLAVYADDTARDAAITSPTAGMMIFNTTGTKFQGYTGAAWVDLN